MAKEIERKFLVINRGYQTGAEKKHILQGYLSLNPLHVVRVRIEDDMATITIKGKAQGNTRNEFEYEIEAEDANIILDQIAIKPLIEKYRYKTEYNGHLWDVDEFLGENRGLVIAEIELDSEKMQFDLPPWVGREVSGELGYYNINLVKKPYTVWKDLG